MVARIAIWILKQEEQLEISATTLHLIFRGEPIREIDCGVGYGPLEKVSGYKRAEMKLGLHHIECCLESWETSSLSRSVVRAIFLAT